MTTYTVRQLREFLTVLYGGTQRTDSWYPHTATVAKRRHVHPNSVRRWIKGELDDPAPIPQARLRLLLRGYQVTRATRTREHHERDRLEVMAQRQRLGRGRGNLKEYRRLGWLDPHSVLIIEDHNRPLRRITVTRANPTTVTRAIAGGHLVHTIREPDRFAAERTRHTILAAVDDDRIQLPRTRLDRGHTQVWLAGAPLPT